MAAKLRQVFAFSGVLNRPPDEKPDPTFLEYAVSLAAGSSVRRVCFIPTATGDAPGAIEAVTDVFTGREDVEFSVLKLFTQPNVPHYVGTELREAVTMVDGARAWRVEPSPPGGYHVEAITPSRL